MANHRHDNQNRLNPKKLRTSPAVVDGSPISLHTGYGNGLNKLTKAARQAAKEKATESVRSPHFRAPAFVLSAVNRFFAPNTAPLARRLPRAQARG